jgi:excinuclease ABC subunit B
MFSICSAFSPKGDQPKAIEVILASLEAKRKHTGLLGVTGSGKTFTVAQVIAQRGVPALVIAPNKTLAAQLYVELRGLFPKNPVGYFISYYDYYQPEAYLPSTDTYIAKDSSINEDIDKMRHESTRFLFEEKHSIIVASVSCIYGLGSPKAYAKLVVTLKVGQSLSRDNLLRHLVEIQYTRNDWDLVRGTYRVRGPQVDIFPSHEKEQGLRVGFEGDKILFLSQIDVLRGRTLQELDEVSIYPNSHYVSEKNDKPAIVREILEDLGVRLRELKKEGKLLEAQRLEDRTMMDMELFEELGFCPGIENYSRYLNHQPPGAPPACLLDYFPEKFLTVIDESHVTLPQIGGMYRGDRSRKETLVNHGFRLPSALDNRPLNFQEFLLKTDQILYVSATPGPLERDLVAPFAFAEQIIRPTGLLDPPIGVVPAKDQVSHLLGEIKKTVLQGGRVLITTLTKKMAQDLTDFYKDKGLRVRYLHSDIDSLERMVILSDLRKGVFDVLVGINLLREGLDLPEVSLVAILDADKEGFLRSQTSLIQTVGRAARNSKSQVIFYGDKLTKSMEGAILETSRRRVIQEAYNKDHGIKPETIIKDLPEDFLKLHGLDERQVEDKPLLKEEDLIEKYKIKNEKNLEKLLQKKRKEMGLLAKKLKFEDAAQVRDEIRVLSGIFIKS